MDRATFDEIRRIVRQEAGIRLSDSKKALVEARLAKRMRELGFQDARAYVRHLAEEAGGEEHARLIDAIATNVTRFFREAEHFNLVGAAVAEWLRQGRRRFRFWSAACSSGEEPYSLALVLAQALDGTAADVKILATDISTRMLELAREGRYGEEQLRPVPQVLRAAHFSANGGPAGRRYQVRAALRRMVAFHRLNLAAPPFPMKGPFDAVLCRNVMIYLDEPVRARLLREFRRLVRPGGYLLVGHAESLLGMTEGFEPVRPSIYRRR
ncbi:MAG: protein-glutamate O-methyltransferase CheR [Deferrisomatales bacterium]